MVNHSGFTPPRMSLLDYGSCGIPYYTLRVKKLSAFSLTSITKTISLQEEVVVLREHQCQFFERQTWSLAWNLWLSTEEQVYMQDDNDKWTRHQPIFRILHGCS